MSALPDSFIRFEPIYQTRVWGGRLLAARFGRDLPDPDLPFGESWEISARAEADSRVVGGSFDGRRLTELWSDRELRSLLFGEEAPEVGSFPLLFKILDARDTLSIQVHPPASVAAEFGGEPKTEVWYIADAAPGAMLYVGVKEGIDEARFRDALAHGEGESCVHAVPVKKGQHLFIPSGRLHAIGAGLLIYEIQQNSDTTYRVYDWNRPGIDGKPRELHVEESLRCIDFSDVTPGMDEPEGNLLVACEHFRLECYTLAAGATVDEATRGRFAILTIVAGEIAAEATRFREGDFFLVPHGGGAGLHAVGEAEVLLTTWP
jgi:mannose-6-phosphate isomerase